MNNLKTNYSRAANNFLEKIETENKVISVFITGSFFNNNLKEGSDLDMFVITEPSNFREKGIDFIDGIKIGYFINPIDKVYYLLHSERTTTKRPTAEMVFFSECVEDKYHLCNNLKKVSEFTLNTKRDKLSNENFAYFGWKVKDKTETIKRMKLSLELGSHITFACHDLFSHLIDIFFSYHQSYIPNTKYVLFKVKNIDTTFYEYVCAYLNNGNVENLLIISEYMLNLLKFNHSSYKDRTKFI